MVLPEGTQKDVTESTQVPVIVSAHVNALPQPIVSVRWLSLEELLVVVGSFSFNICIAWMLSSNHVQELEYKKCMQLLFCYCHYLVPKETDNE